MLFGMGQGVKNSLHEQIRWRKGERRSENKSLPRTYDLWRGDVCVATIHLAVDRTHWICVDAGPVNTGHQLLTLDTCMAWVEARVTERFLKCPAVHQAR